MKKEDYIAPAESWLVNQFRDIPFGIMRPSEIETILSFFIIYHNGDIEEDESKLAVKYRITESKARKLKIEFAQRYGKQADIAAIILRLFENRELPFELSDDRKTVNFMIKDPFELKLIRNDLFNKNIVYYGDFSGKMIKLSIPGFISFMAAYYTDLKGPLSKIINEDLDNADEKNKVYWDSLRLHRKADYTKEKYGPALINGIFSLIGAAASVKALM